MMKPEFGFRTEVLSINLSYFLVEPSLLPPWALGDKTLNERNIYDCSESSTSYRDKHCQFEKKKKLVGLTSVER